MSDKLITISFPQYDSVSAHHFGEAMLRMAATWEERPYPIVHYTESDLHKELDELLKVTPEGGDQVKSEPVVVQQDLTAPEPVEGSNPGNYAPGSFIYMVAPNDVDCRLAASDAERDELLAEGWKIITKEQHAEWEPKEPGHPGDLDKQGYPWDERIHSGSKGFVKDGTWRLRKKPTDMADEQWADTIAAVRAEIKQPEIAEQGDDFNTDAGPVTEQTVAGIPPIAPPVVAPPLAVEPPANMPAPDVYNGPTTFPDLMTFLVDHAAQTQPHLAVTCARAKIETVRDLHTMPEAIPAFYTDLINTCGL